jgi:type IV pilus assembly protein PilB
MKRHPPGPAEIEMDALVELLIQAGLVERAEAHKAAEVARTQARSAPEIMVEQGLADERALYQRVAAHLGVELGSAERLFGAVDARLVASVPRRYQDRERVMPIQRRDGALRVVSCNPDAPLLDLAEALDATRAELLLLTPTDFRRLRWAADLGQLAGGVPGVLPGEHAELLRHDVRVESAHVGLVESMLIDAVAERASDLHLERYGERVRVRLRIDGDLHDVSHYRIRPDDLGGVLNVIKVRSGLDIAERRRPQGGRFTTRVAGRNFDLRVQLTPTLHGEAATLRLLPQDRERFSIDALGFSTALEREYRRVLRSPAGLLLVVGPTGSGKSTTLYAGLQILAGDPTRKVVAIEDPIEFSIEGIHQTQARADLGLSFADAMRTFVRHDPDVIFVGEIRDEETAREALRASQTGHLVLSTLHANDSVDAVQRLFDLGMHPNSIAAELHAVLAQRLAKRICPGCREPAEPDPALAAEILSPAERASFRCFRGRGCEQCSGRGSHGRVALGEFLPSTRALRVGISHHPPLDELRTIAARAGLVRLREHALELVREGTVAFDELPAIATLEWLAPSP